MVEGQFNSQMKTDYESGNTWTVDKTHAYSVSVCFLKIQEQIIFSSLLTTVILIIVLNLESQNA
jgi:hypothetical protein